MDIEFYLIYYFVDLCLCVCVNKTDSTSDSEKRSGVICRGVILPEAAHAVWCWTCTASPPPRGECSCSHLYLDNCEVKDNIFPPLYGTFHCILLYFFLISGEVLKPKYCYFENASFVALIDLLRCFNTLHRCE